MTPTLNSARLIQAATGMPVRELVIGRPANDNGPDLQALARIALGSAVLVAFLLWAVA